MTHRSLSMTGNLSFFLFIVFLITNISSCTLVKPNTNIGELEKLTEMSKGPCFGFCPIYTLTVYTNGVVTYFGERNTNRQGTHLRVLEKSEFNTLKNMLASANLWQYQDLYKGNLPDLQTVTITYWEEGDFKTISGKDGRPEVVVKIEEILEDIANTGKWAKLKGEGEAQQEQPNELIVQFEKNVNHDRWVSKFAKQDAKILKRLAPNSLYWLVSFDKEKIDPKEMLRLVRGDKDVVSAELNKVGAPRGR